jgi:hypothetical protein
MRFGKAFSRCVVFYWYPTQDHPDGPSERAWFRVVDGWGYRTAANPAGRSAHPCFRVLNGSACPTLSLPGDLPTFEIVGSFACLASGVAWFRIVEEQAA